MSKKIPDGSGEFKISMPIEKSFTKDVEGETHMYIAGIASGTNMDLDGERMAASAIQAFSKAIDEGIVLDDGRWSLIPLKTEHQAGWHEKLGWITKASIDDHNNLWIEAELDDTSSTARDLFAKLHRGDRPGKPLQLGFSVGGSIKKASREWDQELNRSVRVIEDVLLKEISVVGRPANPLTYVEALNKSVNWEDVPAPKEELQLQKELDMSDVSNPVTEEVTPTIESTQPVEAVAENTTAEVAKNESESEVTDPQSDLHALVASLQATVAQLAGDFKAYVTQNPAQEAAVEEPVAEEATDKSVTIVETEVVAKSESSLEDRIVAAITQSLSVFKSEVVDPLTAQLETVKSTVEEVAAMPMDKSIAVTAAKEDGDDDPVTKFQKEVATNGTSGLIRKAVAGALGIKDVE